jgi:phosphopantothenoylcysteine decarboxylase/phosphopantothenate--cysteine ligase
VVAATDAPVVVAPAMNPAMWRQPAIRRNVDQLRADGVYVIEPSFGYEVANGAHEGFGPDAGGAHG